MDSTCRACAIDSRSHRPGIRCCAREGHDATQGVCLAGSQSVRSSAVAALVPSWQHSVPLGPKGRRCRGGLCRPAAGSTDGSAPQPGSLGSEINIGERPWRHDRSLAFAALFRLSRGCAIRVSQGGAKATNRAWNASDRPSIRHGPNDRSLAFAAPFRSSRGCAIRVSQGGAKATNRAWNASDRPSIRHGPNDRLRSRLGFARCEGVRFACRKAVRKQRTEPGTPVTGRASVTARMTACVRGSVSLVARVCDSRIASRILLYRTRAE